MVKVFYAYNSGDLFSHRHLLMAFFLIILHPCSSPLSRTTPELISPYVHVPVLRPLTKSYCTLCVPKHTILGPAVHEFWKWESLLNEVNTAISGRVFRCIVGRSVRSAVINRPMPIECGLYVLIHSDNQFKRYCFFVIYRTRHLIAPTRRTASTWYDSTNILLMFYFVRQ